MSKGNGGNTLKWLGIATTIGGGLLSIFSMLIDDKKTEVRIADQVEKAVTKRLGKGED